MKKNICCLSWLMVSVIYWGNVLPYVDKVTIKNETTGTLGIMAQSKIYYISAGTSWSWTKPVGRFIDTIQAKVIHHAGEQVAWKTFHTFVDDDVDNRLETILSFSEKENCGTPILRIKWSEVIIGNRSKKSKRYRDGDETHDFDDMAWKTFHDDVDNRLEGIISFSEKEIDGTASLRIKYGFDDSE